MSSSAATIDIQLAPLVAEQLKTIKARATTNPQGFEGIVWASMNGLITKGLARPDIAFAPFTELGSKRHDFTGFRRTKHKRGPRDVRVIFVGCPVRNAVRVLLLGERLPGQPTDVYEALACHLDAGDFDFQLAEVGMVAPKLIVPPTAVLLTPATDPWAATLAAPMPPPSKT